MPVATWTTYRESIGDRSTPTAGRPASSPTTALDLRSYLVPRKPAAADAEEIRRRGRGIAYIRSAFAYVFDRVGVGG